MALIACGINHKTAPIAVREKLVFPVDSIPASLTQLVEQTAAKEAVILSTCNRTEIYCDTENPESIIDWLHKHRQLSQGKLNAHFYWHHQTDAVKHILRVATGLDSMLIGEPQILGQVKAAFSLAKTAGTLGKQFKRLSQYIFSTTKQIRTQTAINKHPISVAYAAAQLPKCIFADLSNLTVLLIGAGETIELTARHFKKIGVKNFLVTNRTPSRAEKIAKKMEGKSFPFKKIPDYLSQADIVITATSSDIPILGKGAVESAIKKRKRRVMLMIDLAVPRDIEAEVAELEDVYLYTVDDLQNVIKQNLDQRQAAANEAEILVAQQASHYVQQLRVVEATPLICAYRAKMEMKRDEELNKAHRALQMGTPAEVVLKELAWQLTNKFLHAPTQHMRAAAYAGKDESLSELQQLLAIELEK